MSKEANLSKITHLAIGAHQDDIEIMAGHGIVSCFNSSDKHFAGITCTDGAGSPRCGEFADITDQQMCEIRKEEQMKAATLGKYEAMIQLEYPSSAVKSGDAKFIDQLSDYITKMKPEVIYTHNPTDKHLTHVAVAKAVIEAIRKLPLNERPKKVYGSEVWRGLDWLSDDFKVVFNLSGHQELLQSLIAVYKSQIAGGKRYDLATIARMRANATFFESHETDDATHLWFAMDLTDLIRNDSLDLVGFVGNHITEFQETVKNFLD